MFSLPFPDPRSLGLDYFNSSSSGFVLFCFVFAVPTKDGTRLSKKLWLHDSTMSMAMQSKGAVTAYVQGDGNRPASPVSQSASS